MIRSPAFWWQETPTLAARALAPLGAIYGWLTLRRMARPGTRAACRVVCIGNFTTGGSGKTPVAMHVAMRLIARGERPMFLSRGYGGRVTMPTRVDPERHSAADVGDEPMLLARVAPVIVSPDRVAGAAMAVAAGASVIIMDDGMQNPDLVKDLTIAVIDARSGFGNGMVFPAGPLRAPVAGQLPFANAAIVIGDGAVRSTVEAQLGNLPSIGAALSVPTAIAARLQGQKVIAMAGIGLPAKFEATLTGAGATVIGRHFVADHAPYTATELEDVAKRARALGALVATTEKDAVRIGPDMPPALTERLIVVPVNLMVNNGDDVLDALLVKVLGRS
ncbi:MAG: tetraacyldisaccharide 4'-kinase [Bosea sp. (in: a-proteobacteria)]